MVALGTTFSAFWILVNNSWMQVPTGYVLENGAFVPNDWGKILFNSVVWSRFPHMLLASYLTGAFCVAATGAWYVLRKLYHAEARIMLRMGLGLAAVLMPTQLLFGHLCGEYVGTYQPSKMAAIEGRWNDEKPGSEVLFAWPDVENRRNRFAITLPPPFGSLIDSDSLCPGGPGLNSIPPENWPPVLIPFFAFRIMVGCGLLMLALAWVGSFSELQASPGVQSSAALADLPELSAAVRGHHHRLVYRRSRPPAVGHLWRVAHRGRDDAVPDDDRGDNLARDLLHGLRLHLPVRHVLHLPADPHRPGAQTLRDAASRGPEPADVAGR